MDDRDIGSVGLSVRTVNCLRRAGHDTVDKALAVQPSWQLVRIKGFGLKCLKEIEAFRRGEIPDPQKVATPATPVIAVDEYGASSLVGITVSTLQKMRMRGEGPRYAKIGRLVRYRPEDLQAYIDERVGA